MHLNRLAGAKHRLLLASVCALVLLSGCSNGDKAPVSGKVTYNGAPVTGGSLTFLPQASADKAEPGMPAAAVVQSDGSYVLGTEGTTDGAVIGRHKVSYSPPVMEPAKELQPGESPPPSPFDGLGPKQAEVEVKSGSNTIDIELAKPSI